MHPFNAPSGYVFVVSYTPLGSSNEVVNSISGDAPMTSYSIVFLATFTAKTPSLASISINLDLLEFFSLFWAILVVGAVLFVDIALKI